MGIIAMMISLTVLGLLYKRMIARDFPEPIGKKQALIQVLLGAVAVPLSLVFTYGFEALQETFEYTTENQSLMAQSILSGFFTAGLTEELAKFMMIAAAFKIFRSTVKNVYEYILIGAAVGFGFTLIEELIYLFNPTGLSFRMIVIAGHLVYGIIMAYFLGMAKYKKITHQCSPTKEYILAFFLPILIHTLYDACTGCNALLDHEDEDIQWIGLGIGLAGILAAFVFQIMILLKFKKNAQKLCSMRLYSDKLFVHHSSRCR